VIRSLFVAHFLTGAAKVSGVSGGKGERRKRKRERAKISSPGRPDTQATAKVVDAP